MSHKMYTVQDLDKFAPLPKSLEVAITYALNMGADFVSFGPVMFYDSATKEPVKTCPAIWYWRKNKGPFFIREFDEGILPEELIGE